MRGPARMGYTNIANRIIGFQNLHQIGQLTLGTAADELTIMHGANPCTVIAAIFHAFKPINQPVRCRLFAYNSDNTAHMEKPFSPKMYKERESPASLPENPLYFV